jgi:hypothetical protein
MVMLMKQMVAQNILESVGKGVKLYVSNTVMKRIREIGLDAQ